jgi:CDP-diacylglycerol---glycerol-3-phosphate 3-phosphatidyltransferase
VLSINTPTRLTLIRLIFSPLFLPLVLVYFLPYNNQIINGILALVFVLLSLTDFFDGYLARKYNQETALGRALDPLADKFLFFSTLIALVTIQKVFFYSAIIFIGREFFIMGLRILALERGFDVPVSWLGKFKTAVQTLYVTLVIGNGYYLSLTSDNLIIYSIENSLLILALFFSLFSAYDYYRSFMRKFQELNNNAKLTIDNIF